MQHNKGECRQTFLVQGRLSLGLVPTTTDSAVIGILLSCLDIPQGHYFPIAEIIGYQYRTIAVDM